MPRLPFSQMKAAPLSLATGFAFFLASPSQAAITFTMLEIGNDVVVSGSGALNLTALNGPITDISPGPFVYPSASSFLLGAPTGVDAYFEISRFLSISGRDLASSEMGMADQLAPFKSLASARNSGFPPVTNPGLRSMPRSFSEEKPWHPWA